MFDDALGFSKDVGVLLESFVGGGDSRAGVDIVRVWVFESDSKIRSRPYSNVSYLRIIGTYIQFLTCSSIVCVSITIESDRSGGDICCRYFFNYLHCRRRLITCGTVDIS